MDPNNLPIHQIADAIAPSIRKAFISNVRRLRLTVPRGPEVRDALARGNTLAVSAALNWREFENKFVFAITPVLLRAALAAGETIAAKDHLQKADDVETLTDRVFRFIRDHPFFTSWVLAHAAIFVRRVSALSQQAVLEVIAGLTERGVPPAQAEAVIRSVIGLNAKYGRAVGNYYHGLRDSGQYTDAQVLAAVDTYAERVLRLQARTHARTQSMDAANAGLLATWQMAREQGLLGDDSQVRKDWLVTPDERLCPICAPVPAMGPIPLDWKFVLGNGDTVLHPTAHPNCRCTMRLVFVGKDGRFPVSPPVQPFKGKEPPKPRNLKPL